MAIVDYQKPLLLNGEDAFAVGQGVWPGGFVWYVSSGVPPVIYPYNDLGAPINDPYFVSRGYGVGTYLLENGEPDCASCLPCGQVPLPNPLVVDKYLVFWSGTYSLQSLEDIRQGYEIVRSLPDSIVKLRITLNTNSSAIHTVETTLLNVPQTIQDFYSNGELPLPPDDTHYDDCLIYG